MKNLILVAVILHLVITIREINGNYNFGDIIMFPRACLAKGLQPTYNHYAIYVGPKSGVDVGQGDNDIVHRTGSANKFNCRFDVLKKAIGDWKEKKDNYLDNIEPYKQGTQQEIVARIAEAMKDCKRYNLFTNNCEHFATFIRYGHPMTMQRGSVSQCSVVIQKKAKAILERIKKDVGDEANCEPN